MGDSPEKNVLPQEFSTPLKKDLKCNAFSTPKINSDAGDSEPNIETFQLFLDGLGIDDEDNGEDNPVADSTLEDELSKLETTLMNIELDLAEKEAVYDSGKVKDSFCEDLNDSSSVVPTVQKTREDTGYSNQNDHNKISHVTDTGTKLDGNISNCHFLHEIQEKNNKVVHSECDDENVSQLVLLVSPKTSSEANYLTLDEVGEMSDDTSTNILNEDAQNNNGPLQDNEKNHEYEEDIKNTDSGEEINEFKLLFSNSPKSTISEVDCLTLDGCSDIFDGLSPCTLNNESPHNNYVDIQQAKHELEKDIIHLESKNELIGSKCVLPVISKSSSDGDYLTLDMSGEVSFTTSNNTSDYDVSNNDSVQILYEVPDKILQNNAIDIKESSSSDVKSSIVEQPKNDCILYKEADKDLCLRSGVNDINADITKCEPVSVNVDSVVSDAGISSPKGDISSTEIDDEICIIAEIQSSGLQTKEECLKVATSNVDSHSCEVKTIVDVTEQVQLPNEESPHKSLNDINKENEKVCHSATAISKLLHDVDADLNKENIRDKLHLAEMAHDSNIKKDVVRVAEEFISHDPEENKDNNNEKWEDLRKLTTNPERYRALRQRWQNISIPDPNKNLTTRRCFRKNFIRKKLTAKCFSKKIRRAVEENSDPDNELMRKLRKRKCSSDRSGEPEVKRAKTYPCTILYDEQMAVVEKIMCDELLCLRKREIEAMTNLAILQNLEQEKLRSREGYLYMLTPNAEQLRDRQSTETHVALEHFLMEKKKIQSTRQSELSKLKVAASEIHAFHSFYNGITEDNVNTLLLTEEQVRHLRDIENYYDKINEIYENNGV